MNVPLQNVDSRWPRKYRGCSVILVRDGFTAYAWESQKKWLKRSRAIVVSLARVDPF